jgi:hypothetical protein
MYKKLNLIIAITKITIFGICNNNKNSEEIFNYVCSI